MIELDSHLLKAGRCSKLAALPGSTRTLCTSKLFNTDIKYKCIVIRGNDLGRVDRGEGYRAVNRLNCCDVLLGTDSVHPSSD